VVVVEATAVTPLDRTVDRRATFGISPANTPCGPW
jgi:hypothetical protein